MLAKGIPLPGLLRPALIQVAQVYYQCRACQYQTTLIAGTLFAATKLPLRT